MISKIKKGLSSVERKDVGMIFSKFDKGSSPHFTSNIKRIRANLLIPKKLKAHRQISKKRCFGKYCSYVINKHANFQLDRIYPDEVISKT